jgi:uncharacterized protein with PIN domain
MGKKCMYCGTELSESSVIDFCGKCGKDVWGEKMFNTIVQNMEEARDKGDLVHTNTIGPTPMSEIDQNFF